MLDLFGIPFLILTEPIAHYIFVQFVIECLIIYAPVLAIIVYDEVIDRLETQTIAE